MKQTRLDLDGERNILINLIVSDKFCAAILPILQLNLFKTSYAKTLAKWIKEYHSHYNEAPKQLMQNVFNQKKGSLDDEQVESIVMLLESLSKDYASLSDVHNVDYQIEQAIKYFKIRSLEILKTNIDAAVIGNDPIKGEAFIANYTRVGLPENESINILENTDDIVNAFMNEEEVPFKFRGAVHKVISPVMRGDLYAFIGKPKGFKTYAMMHAAECAMMCGCKVLFFSLEMRKNQVIRRTWQSLVGLPKVEGKIAMPYFSVITEPDNEGKNGLYSVEQKFVEKPAIDISFIKEQQESLKTTFNGGEIRHIALPRFSAAIEDLISYMDNLRYYDNYVPDVVFVDYADILKPSQSVARDEYRQRLNDIWMRLAGLAQEKNINIWTVTQTSRKGLEGDIELDSIAEDFRKIAHCSMLIALNQNKAEREKGVMRFKALVKRDDATFAEDEAVVLQQLAIGKFYLDSKLVKEVEKIDDH